MSTIILDFDNTIANTNQAIIDLYQEMTGDLSTSVNDINEWWFDNATPQWSREQQDLAFINPRLYKLMQPNKNAIEVLNKLHNDGHQLIICTYHNPIGIQYKSGWIHNYLPFIDGIVYLDINNTSLGKSMIIGDFLLDDSDKYLNSAINIKYRVCYGNAGWNQNWEGVRIDSWLQFYQVVNKQENINKLMKLSKKEIEDFWFRAD